MEPNDQELNFYSKHKRGKTISENKVLEMIQRLEQKIQLFQDELDRLKNIQKKQ